MLQTLSASVAYCVDLSVVVGVFILFLRRMFTTTNDTAKSTSMVSAG